MSNLNTLIRSLYEKEFVRFLIVGAANTLFYYVVYLVLLLVVHYTIAHSLAYVGGIVLSYVLNSLFVFRTDLQVSKAVQYPIVYVAQYCLGIVILALAVEIGGLPERLGALIAVALSIPLTFAISRFVLTREK